MTLDVKPPALCVHKAGAMGVWLSVEITVVQRIQSIQLLSHGVAHFVLDRPCDEDDALH